MGRTSMNFLSLIFCASSVGMFAITSFAQDLAVPQCPTADSVQFQIRAAKLTRSQRLMVRKAESQMGDLLKLILSEERMGDRITQVFPELFAEEIFTSNPYLNETWKATSAADKATAHPYLQRWLGLMYGALLSSVRSDVKNDLIEPVRDLQLGFEMRGLIDIFESFTASLFGRKQTLGPLLNEVEALGYAPECLQNMVLHPDLRAAKREVPKVHGLGGVNPTYAVNLYLLPSLVFNRGLNIQSREMDKARIVAYLKKHQDRGEFFVTNFSVSSINLDLRTIAMTTRQEEALSVFKKYRREGANESDLIALLTEALKKRLGE